MGDKYCYLDGSVLGYYDWDKKLHRLDGPAIEYVSGSKRWYINGKHLTEEEFEAHPKRYDYLASLAIEEILSEEK
ncbi:MAG: hypothetical protein HWN81_00640 [Candidatus Lokiarchaeota archaeon]|nr:hypothetical protein [Candidatus Lokiarchaeota archaeon]